MQRMLEKCRVSGRVMSVTLETDGGALNVVNGFVPQVRRKRKRNPRAS